MSNREKLQAIVDAAAALKRALHTCLESEDSALRAYARDWCDGLAAELKLMADEADLRRVLEGEPPHEP